MKAVLLPCVDLTLGGLVRVRVADVSPLLADEALRSEALQGLSPHRQAKVLSCHAPRSRCLSLGVGLLLDSLLAESGLRECDRRYAVGAHGKPVFEGAAPRPFSLSHSGRMAGAALALAGAGVEVGLDVQQVTRCRPELVRRTLSDADRSRLAACADEAARELLFARLWSRAEAYAKATGDGLRWPFPEPPAEAVFYDFAVAPGYCGTLCLLDGGRVHPAAAATADAGAAGRKVGP